ncbi:unnamed protein product [Phytophthora lilii]|uniref:Unnamed protein product n=1 Tax=Phytophthora lilii TaxID=2077276 RepID=A0A9W6XHU4_9STRA|nr:unnamed protein product [Phytophthora lilii]
MVHDPTYDVYIPVVHILVEAEEEWTYWHALHWVRVLSKMEMTPGSITSGFEAALINGVRDQFPNSALIGCLFTESRRFAKNWSTSDFLPIKLMRQWLQVSSTF